MKVCGIEIKGSEAIVCLLSLENEVFNLPDCRAGKLMYPKNGTTSDLKAFQFAFAKLMEDYKIENVVIRERPTKGKFAGGAIGFKLEAAIQLLDNLNVTTMTASAIKESLKRNPVHIPFAETGLKVFQEGAFTTAFAYLMKDKYASSD